MIHKINVHLHPVVVCDLVCSYANIVTDVHLTLKYSCSCGLSSNPNMGHGFSQSQQLTTMVVSMVFILCGQNSQ